MEPIPSAPNPDAMDRDKAARALAASLVGNWKGSGFAEPCCVLSSDYTISPDPSNSQQYKLQGEWCVWAFGVCPIATFSHTGTRSADGKSFTAFSRNRNKLDGEPGENRTNLTGTLKNFDVESMKATYTISGTNANGHVSGKCVLDGRNMTEEVTRDGGTGKVRMTHKKV